MPRKRVAMHHIEEILRLRHEGGRTQREIASGCGLSQSSVHQVLARARAAGLGWPLPEGLDEPALHQRLYGKPPSLAGSRRRAEPDFEHLHQELKKHKHLTLQLLWEEYRAEQPGGYGCSRFCDLYRQWRKKQNLVMRQDYRAGEKLFVDYAGARWSFRDECQAFFPVMAGITDEFCACPTRLRRRACSAARSRSRAS